MGRVVPVACVEEDHGSPEDQDLWQSDYWVFLDWRENNDKPRVIVTGNESWNYGDNIFDSIEELMNTELY